MSWVEFLEWAKTHQHWLTPVPRESLDQRRAQYQANARRLDAERGVGGPLGPPTTMVR